MRHEMDDKNLFEQAKTYAFDYMDTIAARTVYPDTRAIANLARFDEAMQASGAYIQYSDQRDGMLYGPDMSRRARAVEVWAALKYLGRKGVGQLIDGFCDNAASFAGALKENGFRVLNDVVFNQVLVACETPTETRRTLENIQRGGVCWCGGTVWEDRPAIRISVCSWATTLDDVAASIEAFVRARKK